MKVVSRLCAALVAGAVLAGAVSAGEIVWAPSFELGMKKAKAKELPVMVDIYTDWCGWCKKLDKDVYTKPDVVALSKEFVCIKLNPEKDKKNGKLFKVDGYPAIIFTDAKGKELHRIGGYMPAEGFLAEMKKALAAAGKGKEKGKEEASKAREGVKEKTE